jgi:hypothetical protein
MARRKLCPQPRGDVSHPGGDDFFCAARADELIELDVGDRPDKREIALFPADDLIAGGKRNQRFKTATHRDRRAVLNAGNRFPKRTDFAHLSPPCP